MVVEGRCDPEVDGEALRTERARQTLAEQMGLKLAADEDPGPIPFNSVKTQKALEKLLEMGSGDTAVADFKAHYEKATGKKAKRPNFVMALMGWGSSDTGFYQAMFEELVKLEPLADNDLEDLATRRAEAIVREITTTEGLDATRVTAEGPGPTVKASTEAVDTKLRLDVMKPSV